MKKYILLSLVILCYSVLAQTDTTKYPWPTPTFNQARGLTATFGEFRNTGSADHFHNAVDIGEPDGNPVYPSIDGTVHWLSNNGYNSYINVKSIIGGKKKHLTYYHVVPNPNLQLNQRVYAGETVLGTIYNGAAHVHLIERELLDAESSSLGTEINPVRPEGGLTPYYDNNPPVIKSNSLKFYRDNSSLQLSKEQLTGKVDIRIDVRENNGSSSSQVNNGTYILGYRVLSEDGNTVVYEPDDNGIKYRFYFLPDDGYVHRAFVKNVATLSDPIYWLTNGLGEEHINTTLSIPNNYLNIDLLDEGTYLLEIFSEDTRQNKTSKRFQFSTLKLPPELNTVLTKNDSIYFSWDEYNSEKNSGYRIYYSNLETDTWELVADETTLQNSTVSLGLSGTELFLSPTGSKSLKFYIVAVDSAGVESTRSDIYSMLTNNIDAPKLLIVDGFDRFGGNGSWDLPNHDFNTYYSKSINNALRNFNISSASNEAVLNEEVNLLNYDMVVWFLGDESIDDNTLVNAEQAKLAMYLENGGRLFISGEDIGIDLDTEHSSSEFSDKLFYNEYLNASWIHDGLDILYEVNGDENSIFDGLNVKFGQTYVSDAPDDIEPINGSIPIFNYTYERDSTFRKGGIAYTGTFGDSSNIGSLVYLSFPFETIGDEDIRNELMRRIQLYLGFNIVGIDDEKQDNEISNTFKLEQNYPNPFNPVTQIKYTVPRKISSNVEINVFDILGQKVHTIIDSKHNAGDYTIEYNASNLTSGVYYYQLKAGKLIQTKKMILLK